MRRIKDYSLYLVISEEYGNGRSAIEIAGRAIKGGVDIIQMREKMKTAGELVSLGKELSSLCKNSRVAFIINDDPLLAKEVDADGVHLGQGDARIFPPDTARRILGAEKIIGVSTESVQQVETADKEDVDYIAYGPVFCTELKDKCVGTKYVPDVLKITKKPVVFIGGITLSNMDELLQKGAKNISLIRGIIQADDIAAAARNFRERLDIFKERRTKDG